MTFLAGPSSSAPPLINVVNRLRSGGSTQLLGSVIHRTIFVDSSLTLRGMATEAGISSKRVTLFKWLFCRTKTRLNLFYVSLQMGEDGPALPLPL